MGVMLADIRELQRHALMPGAFSLKAARAMGPDEGTVDSGPEEHDSADGAASVKAPAPTEAPAHAEAPTHDEPPGRTVGEWDPPTSRASNKQNCRINPYRLSNQ